MEKRIILRLNLNGKNST